MSKKKESFLNDVKNRFLPLPRSAKEGLEHEPRKEDFNFIKELGIGSFGKVHLVSHKKTKAQYAIKYIDKNDPQNILEKASFNREVEIMYKLNHPNIVKLYGHFEDNEYCYFIMQYIPKRRVFELITKEGQKPNLKLIASVMKDVLNAVYYLHNMNPTIMHRDIKPENILLDQNNTAYLTDFGWSNYKICQKKKRKTICGTPLYLPPEMVGEFGHDETADIWCIGVLLFELITGKVPFSGNDFDTVRLNISRLNISWPDYMDPDAKDLTSKILKLKGKDRLPIEDILGHKFFTKFFPNAVNELIKPDGQIPKIFVVSTDNPKNYGTQNRQASKYSNNNNNNNKTYLNSFINVSNCIKNTKITNNSNTSNSNSNINNYRINSSKNNSNNNSRNKKSKIVKTRSFIVPNVKVNISETSNIVKKSTFARTNTINTSYNTNTNSKEKIIRKNTFNSNNSNSNWKIRNDPTNKATSNNSSKIFSKFSHNTAEKRKPSRFNNINIKFYDNTTSNSFYNSTNNYSYNDYPTISSFNTNLNLNNYKNSTYNNKKNYQKSNKNYL